MKERIKHLIAFVVLVVLDQGTKYWARTDLQENGPVTLISKVLKLLYHENTGAVWGIMTGKVQLLSIVTSIILIGMVIIYFKMPKEKKYKPLQWILVAIIAGAVGNLIDRIALQYVVDFIYFELINFPIFNIADCYVTISCVLLFVLFLFYYKEEEVDCLYSMFSRRKNGKSNEKSNETEEN